MQFKGVIILIMLLISAGVAAQDRDAFAIITPNNAAQLEVIQTIQLTNTYANQIAFNPTNSTQLAAAQDDGTVSIWNVTTGEKLTEWPLKGNAVGIAYTTDGTQVVTADDSGDVIVWGISHITIPGTSPEFIINLKREGETPQIVDTAENNLLAVVYKDGPTRLWNSLTGLLYTTIHGYKGVAYTIDLRSDGKLLAIGYRWGFSEIFIYKLDLSSTQQVYLNIIYQTRELNDLALIQNTDAPSFLDDVGLATVNNFSALLIGDSYTFGPPNMHPSSIKMAYATHLAINQTGQLIAIAGIESTGGQCTPDSICHVEITHFYFPEVEEDYIPQPVDEIVADLTGYNSFITDVIFSHDDRFLATSSMDSTITIWGIPLS